MSILVSHLATSIWHEGAVGRAQLRESVQTTADAAPGQLFRRRVRRPVARRQYDRHRADRSQGVVRNSNSLQRACRAHPW